MNVAPRDLAILIHPTYPENQDRVCTIRQAIQNIGCFEDKGPVWFCDFPTPVRTSEGILSFASIYDHQLRRIAGPTVPMLAEDLTDLTTELECCLS